MGLEAPWRLRTPACHAIARMSARDPPEFTKFVIRSSLDAARSSEQHSKKRMFHTNTANVHVAMQAQDERIEENSVDRCRVVTYPLVSIRSRSSRQRQPRTIISLWF